MRIAVIGGIGSGKSEVVKIARDRGIFCLSADEINSTLLKDSEYIQKIAAAFPSVVKDGEVNRRALASIVFCDEQKRKQLNRIAHPEIMKKISECNEDPLVCELPLYIEGGDSNFDEIVLVDTCMLKRIKRLKGRGMSTKDAIARIRAQVSQKMLKEHATIIVNNNGSLDRLKKDVNALFDELIAK